MEPPAEEAKQEPAFKRDDSELAEDDTVEAEEYPSTEMESRSKIPEDVSQTRYLARRREAALTVESKMNARMHIDALQTDSKKMSNKNPFPHVGIEYENGRRRA